MSEIWTEFVRENEEHITELNAALLELEGDPDDDEAIDRIFRVAHTLKGNCGSLGLQTAGDLAHAMEDLLAEVRAGRCEVTSAFMDDLFEAVDVLEEMLLEVERDGEIETDPTATIERLRARIDAVVERPSNDEIDAVLEGLEPPVDDEHDAYFVRLSIDESDRPADATNGALVVDALVDAFDLLGTDPPRDRIDAGDYGDRFDAVFGSAVGEAAIASALEPVDAVGAFEIVVVTDRFAGSSETESIPDVESMAADLSPDDALNLDVDDLLEEFEEFDDLDALVEDIDDDELEPFEEMGDAGSFDDLLAGHESADEGAGSASAAETGGATPPTSPAEAEVDDAGAVFEELKREVEMVDFEELQAELAELEFDEYEDEVEMADLVGDDADVDDAAFLEDEPETDEDPSADAVDVSLESGVEGTPEPGDEVASGPGDEVAPEAESEGALELEDEGLLESDGEDVDPETAIGDDWLDVGSDAVGIPDEPGSEDADAVLEGDEELDTTAPGVDSDEAVDDPNAGEGGSSETDDGSFEFGPAVVEGGLETEDASVDEGQDAPADETADAITDETTDAPAGEIADAATDGAEDGAFEADAEGDEFTPGDAGAFSPEANAGPDGFAEPVDSFDAEEVAFGGPADDEFSTGVDADADAFDDVDELAFDEETDDAGFDGVADLGFEETDDSFEDEFGDVFDSDSDGAFDAGAAFEADDADGSVEFDGDEDPEVVRVVDEPKLEIPDLSIPEWVDRSGPRSDDDAMGSVRVDVEQIDSLATLVEGLVTTRVRLRDAIESDADPTAIAGELDDLEDLMGDLQETVMDVRLVPLQRVTTRLPRVVRDIAREQDKEVSFELSGGDVELDRSVLDRIRDPLIHLVRNAVDHGIESPEKRETVEKPPEGTVEVRAERSRDRVTIAVEDDGRGIDPDRLRESAVEAGVVDEDEAADLDDEAAIELLFHPGLSTAEEVTDVSGRGVGMDVVERTVEELDGSVSIDSTRWAGTTVTMTLPVSVAIADVIFVESGGEEFGVPLKAVRDIESSRSVETIDGEEHFVTDEEDAQPVISLSDEFETSARTEADGRMVVRVREEIRSVAIRCDRVRDQQEVVVNPFEGFMADIPGVSGATVRGRGEVVPILDVTTL